MTLVREWKRILAEAYATSNTVVVWWGGHKNSHWGKVSHIYDDVVTLTCSYENMEKASMSIALKHITAIETSN